jgi:hypothetical protein
MVVMPVPDLPRDKAMMALSNYRAKYHSDQPLDSEILEQVYQKVGGRLAFLNRRKDLASVADLDPRRGDG